MITLPRSLTTLVVVATMIAVVGCGSPAAAARHNAAPRKPLTPEQATAACRAWIRSHGSPNFDIYHTDQPTPHFETYGTDRDRFTFRHCMSGNG